MIVRAKQRKSGLVMLRFIILSWHDICLMQLVRIVFLPIIMKPDESAFFYGALMRFLSICSSWKVCLAIAALKIFGVHTYVLEYNQFLDYSLEYMPCQSML